MKSKKFIKPRSQYLAARFILPSYKMLLIFTLIQAIDVMSRGFCQQEQSFQICYQSKLLSIRFYS